MGVRLAGVPHREGGVAAALEEMSATKEPIAAAVLK